MFKSILSLLLLLSLTFSANAAYEYRNVSVYEDDAAGLFVATAVRIVVVKIGNEYEGVADALQLAIDNNQVRFLHFAGEESKNVDGTTTNFEEAAFGFYMQFIALGEYLEVNQIPGFQISGDLILSAYWFAGKTWTITKDYSTITFPDNTVGNIWSITYATSDGVFSFTLSYAGKPVTIDGVTIDENTAKLSFNISYYNNPGASSNPAAQIAFIIVAVTAAEAARLNHTSSTQSGLTINSGQYSGYLNFENKADTWDAQAVYTEAAVHYSYDDANSDNATNIIEGYRAGTIILSYLQPTPTSIVHDPEMGSSVPTPSSSSASSIYISSVLILALILAWIF